MSNPQNSEIDNVYLALFTIVTFYNIIAVMMFIFCFITKTGGDYGCLAFRYDLIITFFLQMFFGFINSIIFARRSLFIPVVCYIISPISFMYALSPINMFGQNAATFSLIMGIFSFIVDAITFTIIKFRK